MPCHRRYLARRLAQSGPRRLSSPGVPRSPSAGLRHHHGAHLGRAQPAHRQGDGQTSSDALAGRLALPGQAGLPLPEDMTNPPRYYSGYTESVDVVDVAGSTPPPDTHSDSLPFSSLDPRRFETLVFRVKSAELDDRARVCLMAPGGDQGRDVVAYNLSGSVSYVVQCKKLQKRMTAPEVLNELIKLALHNHLEPSILGEGPIAYELWCPGGLTESAAKIIDTWPRQWTADNLSAAANRVISTYKAKFGDLDWYRIRETLIPSIARLVSPVYYDDVLISARVRAQIDIYRTYFQVNVVAPLADVQAAVEDGIRKAFPELRQLSDADVRHVCDRVYGFPQDRRVAHMAGYIMGINPALIARLEPPEFKEFFTHVTATAGIANTLTKACSRIISDIVRDLSSSLTPPNPGLAHVFSVVLTWSMINKMMGASFLGLAEHKAVDGREYSSLSLGERFEYHAKTSYDQSVTCIQAYDPRKHRYGSDEEYRNRIGVAILGGASNLEIFTSRLMGAVNANVDALRYRFNAYMELVPSEFVVISDTKGVFRDEHLRDRFVASIKLLDGLAQRAPRESA